MNKMSGENMVMSTEHYHEALHVVRANALRHEAISVVDMVRRERPDSDVWHLLCGHIMDRLGEKANEVPDS